MLQLKNIVKNYELGDQSVEALKGVDLDFRQSEFVAVLGPSGCGKTTLLNIIGGLDRYSSGDLIINGISTRQYKDVDWDIYRNNSIGFVFQSYNLIPHQTALANVELAMTLAGISKSERRRRAAEALNQVGLHDQHNKKPGQMSGGQMQRVSIARALVNNPDILLADEPTGALDSETSIQIMDILRDVAKERLVIMVTHNPDIANEYANRIIRLLDGRVTDDTNPYHAEDSQKDAQKKKKKKISMSFLTALSLSLNNLLTKKTRTILTAFAGSIGIIGIALIMSLSSGMQSYINNLEQDTLSTYPIQLESQTMDMTSMMTAMMTHNNRDGIDHDLDKVYSNNIITGMMESLSSTISNNDLRQFKQYIEEGDGKKIADFINSRQYGYAVDLNIYKSDTADGVLKINPGNVLERLGLMGAGAEMSGMSGMNGMGGGFGGMSSDDIWTELIDADELLRSQYDVLAGAWPSAHNEVVLIVNEHNEISDMNLYSLGLMDEKQLSEHVNKLFRGEELDETETAVYTYDELLTLRFKLVVNPDYYQKKSENGITFWADMRSDEAFMKELVDNAPEIKVVGILRPNEEASATSINGTVGYTAELTDYIINTINGSEVAEAQIAAPEINVFTGLAFENGLPGTAELDTYESNLESLGVVDKDNPSMISLYPKDFNAKEEIITLIDEYNKMQEEAGHEEYVIKYTDIVGLMTSSISSIINIVSYVLIAFVAISLIVSSIMIAIITYISVLERTKEIGILRSIGASKGDISRVFNAETIIEGLVAGVLGIGITLLLNIPINIIIKNLTNISGISALPFAGAVGLIVLSVFLTVVAGFVPSKLAAKKDPVVALRTE